MPRLPDYASMQATHAQPAGKTNRLLYQCTRHKGVVLVITLLAVVLLAALVLYVFNLGQQTNSRIAAQTEADSAANAGAAWVARSLNTVSMNNVALARLITNVAVLDAMPMAVAFTYKEQLDAHRTTDPQGISQAISAQLTRGVSDWWARDKFQEMLNRIGRADENRQYQSEERAQELRILESFDNLFTSAQGDVTPMTYYNAPAGRGLLWQGMESLDELNQVTMENVGILAQLNAVRGAQVNADNTGHPTAMMLPVVPNIPYKRGTFADFERPIRNGLLPTDTDNKTTNRGPYDTMYGWRHARGGRTTGHADQTRIVRGSNRNNVPIGRGTDGDYVVTGRTDATAYSVYGPYRWMMYQASSLRRRSLRYSRFDHWLRTISDIKIHYAFHGGATRTIINPQWLIDYEESKTIAQNERSRIVETAFVVVEIKSRFPINQRPLTPQGMETGPNKYWQYVTRHRPSVPWVTRQGGWVDPESWNITKVNDNLWRNDWSYEVFFDRDLGMEPILDANGEMVPQTVYRVDHYMFAGINIGEPVEIRNPFNFPNRSVLPAPTELDQTRLGPENEEAHQQYLTYMAVVRHHDKSSLWPKLFASKSPNPNNMAVAQSQVFNDHSWDLWTQMWRGQLSAIDVGKDSGKNEFTRWINRLEEDQDQAQSIPDLTDQDAADFLQYLRSVESLAPAMLNH